MPRLHSTLTSYGDQSRLGLLETPVAGSVAQWGAPGDFAGITAGGDVQTGTSRAIGTPWRVMT